MKFLIKVVETYRVDTENEVEQFISDLKEDSSFALAKYGSTHKQRKEKGEVVDEWQEVTVTKLFNDAKYPNTEVDITYEVTGFTMPEDEEDGLDQ